MTQPPTRALATPSASLAHIAVEGFCTVTSLTLFLRLDAHAVLVTDTRLESTISAYELGVGRWIFTLAVLLLAAGSAALLIALVGHIVRR
nr:hypothetical protein [Rhodococcus wratislaviensis]